MSGDSPDLYLLEDKNVDPIDKGVISETVTLTTVYANADTVEKVPLEGATEKTTPTVVTKASLEVPNEKKTLDVQIEKVTPVSTDDNDILSVFDDADENDKKNEKEKLKPAEMNQQKTDQQNKSGEKKDEGTQALGKDEHSFDKIDSVHMLKSSGEKVPPMSNSDKEDDDWGLKCLYFSMQCCECTIM